MSGRRAAARAAGGGTDAARFGARERVRARRGTIAAVFLAAALAPGTAAAAACCLSTSTFGAGRLAVWEDAAFGLGLSYATAAGHFDGEGGYHAHDGYTEREGRATAFALVRLARSLEAGVRVPWVVGHRTTNDLDETGHGVGDVALALRWDAFPMGTLGGGLPGIAFTLAASLPTGRAVEESDGVLGADATGSGAASVSAGVSVERSLGTAFLRLDLGARLPFAREVNGADLRAGPGLEAQLGGGVDLGRGVVVALAPRIRWESDAIRDGTRIADSSTLELAVGPSASWEFMRDWTLQASFDTGLPVDGLGANRPLLTTASLGIRRAVY